MKIEDTKLRKGNNLETQTFLCIFKHAYELTDTLQITYICLISLWMTYSTSKTFFIKGAFGFTMFVIRWVYTLSLVVDIFKKPSRTVVYKNTKLSAAAECNIKKMIKRYN
jgi:hypothetical protein